MAKTANGTGSISGKVIDSNEEGAARALVELLELGLQTYTDQDGNFEIADVPVGAHTIRVIATGFRAKRQKIEISPSINNQDIHLDPI